MAQTTYHAVKKIGGECLYPSGDSLLHFGIYCKSLASHVFLKGWEALGARSVFNGGQSVTPHI
jgi:hypothetical protein